MECRYALISVYEKRGVTDLAKRLIKAGYKIIATEGTGKKLTEWGIPFISCQKISGNPVCFDGFMKTMSFLIEGGMLFDRANKKHLAEAKKFGVKQIDIVVCNFFPADVIISQLKKEGAINVARMFDFGGPTMVRVAAQNFKYVVVAVDPHDYGEIKENLTSGNFSLEFKQKLATKAFRYICSYDKDVSEYMESELNNNH